MKEITIDHHALKHHLDPDDIEYAWNHFVARLYRGTSGGGQVVAIGFDRQGHFMEMVATERGFGTVVFHALAPPTDKVLKELGDCEEIVMAKVMSSEEIEETYGLESGLLDNWEEDAAKGVFHGEPREIVYGRPLMFGEQMRQVGFKEPVGRIALIDLRAGQLGMKRSEYLRHLVEEDLKRAGIA